MVADTLALDVDGVLIDVHGSFREVTRTIVPAMQRRLGNRAAVWTPTHSDLAAFKRVGGFNDDIDLSVSLIQIGLTGHDREVAAIVAAIEHCGGGPEGLAAAIPEPLPVIDITAVRRLFDETYWGAERYEELFEERAIHVSSGPGLIERERPLVGAGFLDEIRARGLEQVAIITGRSAVEWEAALAVLGWSAADIAVSVTGESVRKPDPACLDIVVDECGSESMVYVGDTRDDWELVRRYRAERPRHRRVTGVIVDNDDSPTWYRNLGVDIVVSATVDVLGLFDTRVSAGAPE